MMGWSPTDESSKLPYMTTTTPKKETPLRNVLTQDDDESSVTIQDTSTVSSPERSFHLASSRTPSPIERFDPLSGKQSFVIEIIFVEQ